MIATCTQCSQMFETTEEDACTPGVLCVRCYRREQAARVPAENCHQKAARLGREAKANGGDWRDNPYSPGTRQWFEFNDSLTGDGS